MWELGVLLTKYSPNSCNDKKDLFQMMFKDRKTAHKFTCRSTMGSCFINLDIGLISVHCFKMLWKCSFFMYSFNECHNNKIKKRQMDMMIRYWDNSTNLLSTRYCNSDFSCCCCFGKASTDDFRTKFEICSSPTNKMIQVYFNKSNSVDHSNSTLFFYL